jgi:hypothetical protein
MSMNTDRCIYRRVRRETQSAFAAHILLFPAAACVLLRLCGKKNSIETHGASASNIGILAHAVMILC